MPVVPSTHTVTGGVATTSEMNSFFRDPINFLLNPPIAELRQVTPQSIPNTTWTALAFDTEDVDTDVDGIGGHDNVTNNSRYTARYAGRYLVGGGIEWTVNVTGTRGLRWAVNSTPVNASDVFITAAGGVSQMAVPARVKRIFLNVGDFVELQCWQSSGGALLTVSSAEAAASMSVGWVRN